MLKVRQKETVSMVTRDGVRLDADVYRPEEEGRFPVLLMRQPYGRAIASTVVYAHPIWYASHGYIVAIQDVRGRGTSEGKFELFTHEISDGFDTVNWAANLPGSNGNVGMYGFSYQGMTQLYAAAAKPAALKTICPAMIAYDLYADWAYEGGAFCLQNNFGWAIQLAAETARLKGDTAAYQILCAASRNLPFYDPEPFLIACLRKYAPNNFYYQWSAHPQPDEYWEELSPKKYLQDVDLPMLHIGGWFDTHLRGTINLYKEMAAKSALPQHIGIGPWAHLPWGRKVGAIDYGPEAESLVDRVQIRWFDQFLKGLNTGLLDEPPVSLFEMGSNQWRYFDRWPSNNQKSYYLASTGLASVRQDEGTLEARQQPTPLVPRLQPGNEYGEVPPPQEQDIIQNLQSKIENSFDVFVHDPWRPVPASGGHAAIPAGSFDRSAIDCRTDVLTYTSALLEEDLHIAGDVAVEVFCTADTPSFDLCAVLSEVRPDGSVYNFTQGYMRIDQKKQGFCRIPLQATCVRIAKGNALRLSLSAACFPAYAVNCGTGASSGETRLMNVQIITITVSSGEDFPSQVLLPVVLPS